jgi:aminopeptidase-like protein
MTLASSSVVHADAAAALDPSALEHELYALVERLYPIHRSITGDGVRETLRLMSAFVPLTVHEVPTGTPVFDWEIPKEWRIGDAFIRDRNGRRVVDIRNSNLHVVGYSVPVRATLPLSELKRHLHTLPDRPDSIPYLNSFWQEYWGFCLSHHVMETLPDDEYEVCIDSSLEDGFLTYGEYLVPGHTTDEVLLFSHTCHPSLCNDNCSGLAVSTLLARVLGERRRRYSYRFIWAPSTIGSLAWLSRNPEAVSRVRHGLVLSGFGDSGVFTYKRSRRGDAVIDRVVPLVLRGRDEGCRIDDFSVYGYDERQFCSPGFNLPVGRLTRTPYGEYPQYHTSADNLNFIDPARLGESLVVLLSIVDAIESGDRRYRNRSPWGEPRLGKRGLFRPLGGGGLGRLEEARLWVLNLADGGHTVLDMAERSKLDLPTLYVAIDELRRCDLLEELSEGAGSASAE